jgi:hypothetical protein
MSFPERISFIAWAILVALACYVAYGSSTQWLETQTEGARVEQPSVCAPAERKFILREVRVGLEEDAPQADLAALKQRTDARTE